MQSLRVLADDHVVVHVGVTGAGPDVLVLSGGPGCVNYLEHDSLAPRGTRTWFPEPRGVGRSEGGPHDIDRAIGDLEAIRRQAGIDDWTVLGHSWGADLAVRYALEHPDRVRAVVGVAGHGLHKDRSWSRTYEALKHTEDDVVIDWDRDVHQALSASFDAWIHQPQLYRQLADSHVPMTFIAAELDIRPDWPLRQLAALVPGGVFLQVPGAPHHLWWTHPHDWTDVVTAACRATT